MQVGQDIFYILLYDHELQSQNCHWVSQLYLALFELARLQLEELVYRTLYWKLTMLVMVQE